MAISGETSKVERERDTHLSPTFQSSSKSVTRESENGINRKKAGTYLRADNDICTFKKKCVSENKEIF